MARNKLVLAVSLTLLPLRAEAEAFTACVAESMSCESSASHAFALGSATKGSGVGDDAEHGEPGVGEDGADEEVGAAALGRVGEAGEGVAGGPMLGDAASPVTDRLGDDGEDDDLGTRPGMTALARRTLAVLMDRTEAVGDVDDDPVEAEVVVEVDEGAAVDDTETALLEVDVEDADEEAARLREAWGDTVESCSWISIMWSPNRIVRLRGALPERKSFTCPSFRLSSACITLCSGR